MRHGKSDWQAGAADDFSRPLAARGQRDSPRIGRWLAEHGLLPDYIACSPAVRANETALLVCQGAGLSTGCIYHDERLYLAGVSELLAVINDIPKTAGAHMVIGHNPGLKELLVHLAGERVTGSGHRKLMPTAALAQLQIPGDDRLLSAGSARLLAWIRPRELID